MAFNPDDYLAKKKSEGSGFNPDAYLEKAKSETKDSHAGQAFLEKYGSSVSGDNLSHIQSGFEQVRSAIDTGAAKLGIGPETPEMVNERLKNQGFNIIEPGNSYVGQRDANIKRQAQLAKDEPDATTLGSVAGFGGGLAIPVGKLFKMAKIAKDAPLAVKAWEGAKIGAKTGALYGAVQNPGDVEGDVALMPEERAKNAVMGGVIGGTLGGGLPTAVEGVKRSGKWLGQKIGSALTGIPSSDIANYTAKTDEVNNMIRESGGNLTDAADKIRVELQAAIRSKRQSLSNDISEALSSADAEKVHFTPIKIKNPKKPVMVQDEVLATPIRIDENPLKGPMPWLRPEDVPPKIVRGDVQPVQSRLFEQPKPEVIPTKGFGPANTASKTITPVDSAPIISQLKAARGSLNTNLKPEAASQLDDMIQRITTEAKANDGRMTVRQLFEVKEFLQERAASAYSKDGKIFQNARESAQAAKNVGAMVRKQLNQLSPEIAEANNQLSYLHSLEEKLNKNLIAPGKPESALIAAGSGDNQRNAKMLGKLGDFAGYPIVEKAQNLATARSFSNPSLLPTDKTGKAVGRMLLGSGAGSVVAGPVGAVVGGALASPMTLKAGINASNVISKALSKYPSIVELSQSNPGLVARLAAGIGQDINGGKKNYSIEQDELLRDPEVMKLMKNDESLIEAIQDPRRRALIKSAVKRMPASK